LTARYVDFDGAAITCGLAHEEQSLVVICHPFGDRDNVSPEVPPGRWVVYVYHDDPQVGAMDLPVVSTVECDAWASESSGAALARALIDAFKRIPS
jgi:hypothetical protein